MSKPLRQATILKYKEISERYAEYKGLQPSETRRRLESLNKSKGNINITLSALRWAEPDIQKKELYRVELQRLRPEIKAEKILFKNKCKKIEWNNIRRPTGYKLNDLIIALYIYFPPRRLSDYAKMVYTKERPKEMNKERNYYIANEGKYVFNEYKTVNAYGVQTFEVSEELKEMIEGYVKVNKIKEGEQLLKFRKSADEFSNRALRERLKKIFGTSVDGLRHAFITYTYKNPDNLYNIQEISLKMGHDVKTHLIEYLDKDNKVKVI